MNAKQFAEQMKADIEEAKSKGTTVIESDKVIAYLDIFLNSTQAEPSAKEVERYKAFLETKVARYQYDLDSALENIRATISIGQNAIKSGLILNGGAAVALLAFISHLAGANRLSMMHKLTGCLAWFSYGALVMAFVSALAYLTHWFGANKRSSWSVNTSKTLNVISIAGGLFSYYLFTRGILSVQAAFDNI